jgi:hypothetical protein
MQFSAARLQLDKWRPAVRSKQLIFDEDFGKSGEYTATPPGAA